MNRLFLTAPFFLVLLSSAQALDCKDGGSTQVDMNICADQAYQTADAVLNQKFEKIMSCLKLLPEAKPPLLAAQRAWINFRDAECKFQSSASEGGSV